MKGMFEHVFYTLIDNTDAKQWQFLKNTAHYIYKPSYKWISFRKFYANYSRIFFVFILFWNLG